MIGLDLLQKIIIAYFKAGGDKVEKSNEEIAQISGVSQNNISSNNKFFASIGLLEGSRGAYKLTQGGAEYAKALDWGRLNEAQAVLRRTIKDKTLVVRTIGYVDLNKPVNKDDLVGKIANTAGVKNEPRFSVGIRAFVELLILSGLLAEDKDGNVIAAEKDFIGESIPLKRIVEIPQEEEDAQNVFPVNITIAIDNNTDIEKLKSMLKAIREVLLSKS
jgi:hypothetical protein